MRQVDLILAQVRRRWLRAEAFRLRLFLSHQFPRTPTLGSLVNRSNAPNEAAELAFQMA
jgi:hypothetical protein